MSTPFQIETLEQAMPGLGKASNGFEDFKVKIQKFDLDDPIDVVTLEQILTKGMIKTGESVLIFEKQTFTFNDQYFMVVTYAEKGGSNAG